PLGRLRKERHSVFRSAKSQLERAKENQRDIAQQYHQRFQHKMNALLMLKTSYEQLRTQQNEELGALRQQVHKRQLEYYLQQCFISGARIDGIGPGRKASLESYGIET